MRVLDVRSDSSERVPLDYEEYELFSTLMWALGSVQERGGPPARDVISLLPQRNALTQWASEWLHP